MFQKLLKIYFKLFGLLHIGIVTHEETFILVTIKPAVMPNPFCLRAGLEFYRVFAGHTPPPPPLIFPFCELNIIFRAPSP